MYFTCNKNVNIYVGFVFNYTQSNINVNIYVGFVFNYTQSNIKSIIRISCTDIQSLKVSKH